MVQPSVRESHVTSVRKLKTKGNNDNSYVDSHKEETDIRQ